MAAENALVIWARGLAQRAAADPIIKAAKDAAETLRNAIVQTPEDAASVTALLDGVRKGRLNAKKSLDDILRDPKSAIAEAKGLLDPIITAFEEVETAGKASVTRYLLEQQRLAQEAERKAREEAARVAEEAEKENRARAAAAAAAESAGLPVMEYEEAVTLAMEVPAAPVQSIVRSEAGASVHLVKRLHVEMIDAVAVAVFDGAMLKLVDSEALAAYRHYSNKDEPPEDSKPHPLGGIDWHGMRFYEETTVAQRGSR